MFRGLWIYLTTLLALTALAWGTYIIRGPIQHKIQLHESLFCCPGIQFSDFVDLSARVAHFGEPHMLTRNDFTLPYPGRKPFPYSYPVPTVYVFLFFVRLFPTYSVAAYLLGAIVAFLAATVYLSLRVGRLTEKKFPKVTVWATLLCSFPVLILLDRGNIEAVIWVLVLLGLAAYTRNQMLIAAILWAAAASMKIFPGLLFVLFLARRRFGIFATAVGVTALFSVLALVGIGPTIHQAAIESSKTADFVEVYIFSRATPQFDHSIFAGIKTIEQMFIFPFHRQQQAHSIFKATMRIYSVIVPLACVLLYWFRLRKLPQLNQFIAYMVLAILLPYVSNEYTLIYLYLVWAAFLLFLLEDVAGSRTSIPPAAIYAIMLSCAVCSVPLNFFGIPVGSGHTFIFGGQIKTVFLLLILITVIRFPMPSSLFGELPASAESHLATLG